MNALARLLGRRDSLLAEWAAGRTWWFRLPLAVYGAWLLLAALGDPDRQTLAAGIDLGIHEAGHLLTGALGMTLSVAAGSATQCLAPITAGALLMHWQRDFTGLFFCLSWLGVNAFEVARYMADASAMALPLVSVGGGEVVHDFNYLFDRFGLLGSEGAWAALVRLAGYLCLLAGLAGQVWTMQVMRGLGRRT